MSHSVETSQAAGRSARPNPTEGSGWLIENPVLKKELSTRLQLRRQGKANRIAVAVIAGLVLPIFYFFSVRALLLESPNGARDFYGIFLLGIELTLGLLLAPALTAGCLTIEREKQTWNALLLSRLSHPQIVLGKYVGALVPAFLALLAFLPLNLLSAFRGNISVAEFALSHVVLFVTILVYGAIGLLCSWAFRRTQVSMVVTAAIVAAIILGMPLCFALYQSVSRDYNLKIETFVPMWTSPYLAMMDGISSLNAVEQNSRGLVVSAFLTGSLLFLPAALTVLIARLRQGPAELTH
jgi:ABC-type transport system involved in multi-copper enzyme maturation permease subunit